MNKHIFLYIALIVAASGIALLIVGNKTPREATATMVTGKTTAGFSASVPQFDFGSVSMAKGNVSHDFAITNDTGADILIGKAYTSCMCTETVLSFADGLKAGPFGMPGHMPLPPIDKTIKAGESVTVSAIFNPAAHGPAGIGPIERQVILETNKGQYTLGFKGIVTP